MNDALPGHTARLTGKRSRFVPGIRARLILAILLVALSVSLVGLFVNTQLDMKRIRGAMVENNLIQLAVLNVDFVQVIVDYTPEYAADLVERLSNFPNIHSIVLRDRDNSLVFRYNFHESGNTELPDFIGAGQSSAIVYGSDNILIHHTVTYGGKHYGWVTAAVDTIDVKEHYREYALTAILLMVGTTLIALVLAILAGHYFSRPIRNLAEFVQTVSRDHDFSHRLVSGQVGEIGNLCDGVNGMLDEIKQSQDELHRLGESRVRKIIESALDGVISINKAGEITYWSKQTEIIFGWSEKEVLGRSLADLVIPERFRQQHTEGLERMLAVDDDDALNRRISVAGLHRDGHEIAVEISLSAIRQQGTWTVNAFIRDLSEQIKAEEKMLDLQTQLRRQDKLVAVGQLTATVAHELRNPMGTIRNSLYLLTQKLAEEPVDTVSLVDRIDRNIGRCDAIISELLDFARDRAVLLVPTVIDSWLARLLDGYDFPGGVELVRNLATGTRVPVDIAYFESAVINILNNAVQAAVEKHPGHGRVEVGTVLENGRLGVVISDNGSGIPAGDSERIFDPLYSTRVYGVGLGLPTVRKVMEKHGGEVSIGKGPGGGARATLWLNINDSSVCEN